MSIVNNYKLIDNAVKYVGDYTMHKALPSLTRSDSVLKAIGKAINIRVSSESARKLPIIVLGNTHISNNYLEKIDHLGQYGILQKIISLNPHLNSNKESKLRYFQTPKDTNELYEILTKVPERDFYYFSAMIEKQALGKIIKQSSTKGNEIKIAEAFLEKLKANYDA
ncbi:hypothetical protein LS73_006450 [Helicobacter muridarum]|nr:hypothetical protein [Helicobacter muridarum]TLD99939.1 hypothetical protein LS73_006450 [Helicobacter muridarum]